MSIADKLVTVAENQQKVYDAGKLALLKASKHMNGTASGEAIAANDVSPIEHDVMVNVQSKNLIDLSKFNFIGCINNGDGTLAANMNNVFYCRIETGELNDLFFNNRGKKLTFSVKEVPSDTKLTVVIYGKRPATNQYRQYSSANGSRQITFTVGADFESIESVDFRMLQKDDARYNDTTTIISDIQLEFGDTATAYTPCVEDLSDVTVVAVDPQTQMPTGYAVASDGTVGGIRSVSPNMDITCDTVGVILECSYLRDIDRYCDALTGGDS